MKFWLVTIVFLAFSCLLCSAAPKEPVLAPPPPMPQGQNVSLYQGQSIELTLRAIGRAPSPLRFIIRTPPQHGTLGAINLTGNKSATVRYTHREKEGLAADSFTFAVQGVDGPVSAGGVVNLTISEEPSDFSVTPSLDFPRLWQGESSEQEIVLQNKGGGVVHGKADVLAPWKIIGRAEYSLARKQEAKMRILFAPQEAGDFRDRLTFSHNAQASVLLNGSAAAPLELTPAKKIELGHEGSDNIRSARLSIHNVTEQERVVKFTVPEEIVAPESLVLAPGETKEVALRTKDGNLEGFEGSLQVESDGFREDLPLHAFSVGARLQFSPTAGLSLGEIEGGRRYKSTLSLTNTGGDAAHLRAQVPKEILIQPNLNSEVLAPGETRLFEIAFESPAQGDYQGKIEITAEGGSAIAVPISAKITPAKDGLQKSDPVALTPQREIPLGPSGLETTYNGIKTISDIKTLKTGKYEMEIGWKKPTSKIGSYVLEVRTLKPLPGNPSAVDWIEWRDVKYREENGLSVARIERLPSGQTLFFRLSSLDDAGQRSAPSETIRVSGLPPVRINWLGWLGVPLIIGIIAFMVARFKKRGKLAARADAERLAQLGK